MLALQDYKDELTRLSCSKDKRVFIQKYFLHGIPMVFANREDDYYHFRKRVAENFEIEFYDVFIVGSSKFGYSPIRLTQFSENSDIDVLIVNERLFEKFFQLLCDYEYLVDSKQIKLNSNQLNKYLKFVKYFIIGWMRPDLLPTEIDEFREIKQQWNDFFSSISFSNSEVGNYKVSGGLFKTYHYAEKYYLKSIDFTKSKNNL